MSKQLQNVLEVPARTLNKAGDDKATAEPKVDASANTANAGTNGDAEPTASGATGLRKARTRSYAGNKTTESKTELANVVSYAKLLGVQRRERTDDNGKPLVRDGRPVVACIWTIGTPEDTTLTIWSGWGFYEANKFRVGTIVQIEYDVVEQGDTWEVDGVEVTAESSFNSISGISVADVNSYFRACRKYVRATFSDPDERQDELDELREEQKMLREQMLALTASQA
jgi:hypothetical protein